MSNYYLEFVDPVPFSHTNCNIYYSQIILSQTAKSQKNAPANNCHPKVHENFYLRTKLTQIAVVHVLYALCMQSTLANKLSITILRRKLHRQ